MKAISTKRELETVKAELADNTNWEEVIASFFGPKQEWDAVGKFCLVQLDDLSKNERTERVDNFDPTQLFDTNCPCCQPFLTQGAIVIYEPEAIHALRLGPKGTIEMAAFPVDKASSKPASG